MSANTSPVQRINNNGNCIKMDLDDVNVIDDDDEISDDNIGSSISSEEDVASESDFKQRVRVKQEIWNGEEVWNALITLPGAENVIEQLNDENLVLEIKNLETLLLFASWLGCERGVKLALEHGQDPNVADPEGR